MFGCGEIYRKRKENKKMGTYLLFFFLTYLILFSSDTWQPNKEFFFLVSLYFIFLIFICQVTVLMEFLKAGS